VQRDIGKGVMPVTNANGAKTDRILNAVLDLVKLTAGHTERLDGINDRLDGLNGSVKRHDEELKKLQCNYVQFRERSDSREIADHVEYDLREKAIRVATDAREAAVHSATDAREAAVHSATDAREAAVHSATDAREAANQQWRTWLKYPLVGAGAFVGLKLIECLPAAYQLVVKALMRTP
jgi:TolA-binding protein